MSLRKRLVLGLLITGATGLVVGSWVAAGRTTRSHAEAPALAICVGAEEPSQAGLAVSKVGAAAAELPAAHQRLRGWLGSVTNGVQPEFRRPSVTPCDLGYEPLDVQKKDARGSVRGDAALREATTNIRVFVMTGNSAVALAGQPSARMPYQFRCLEGGNVCFEGSTAVYVSPETLGDHAALVKVLENAAGLAFEARVTPKEELSARERP